MSMWHFQGNKVKEVAGMLHLISVKAKQAQEIAGTKHPPSMWAQLKEQGRTENYSKTIHKDGNTIHIQQPPQNTVSRAQLEVLRLEMQKKISTQDDNAL